MFLSCGEGHLGQLREADKKLYFSLPLSCRAQPSPDAHAGECCRGQPRECWVDKNRFPPLHLSVIILSSFFLLLLLLPLYLKPIVGTLGGYWVLSRQARNEWRMGTSFMPSFSAPVPWSKINPHIASAGTSHHSDSLSEMITDVFFG